MKLNIRTIISFLLLIGSVWFLISFLSVSKQNQRLKVDKAELNNIKYGLFNINVWKDHFAVIISDKIIEFELNTENKELFKEKFESILYQVIDRIDSSIREKNATSIIGIFKQVFTDIFLDLDELKDEVPEIVDIIINELDDEDVKINIKALLLEQLNSYIAETMSDSDMQLYKSILEKYDSANKESCLLVLDEQIHKNKESVMISAGILIVAALLIFFLLIPNLSVYANSLDMIILLLISLVLLLGGVITPMIEIEAKISELSFTLLGTEISFTEQIIYFQSKSILDVVVILMNDKDFLMILTGVLIFSFSILFPFLKLSSLFVYFNNFKGLRSNGFIRFFALKSGKWSMADVFVVAIFMAYIGFNGIVKSQMMQLNRTDEAYEVLTTNGTNLEYGFYLFLLFCISGLFMAQRLEKKISKV
jgi:hypothetical protein